MGLGSDAGLPARLAAAALMAVGYYALSRVGLAFVESETEIATIWPASGLALATFVVVERSWWPWLTAGIFVGNLIANLGARDDVALNIALGAINAAEPLLAATVMLAIAGRHAPLALTMRSIGGLLAAVTLANAVTALLAATVVAVGLGASFPTTFVHWWIADGVGMLALAPLALIFGDRTTRAPARPWEAVGLLAATTGVTLAVFLQGPDSFSVLRYAYLVFPFVVIPALRLRAWLVAVNLAIVVTIVAAATAKGLGPFVRDDLTSGQEVVIAQGYIAVMAICSLLVAAVVRQARVATAALKDQHAVALASEARYRLLANHTADMISVHRLDGPSTYVSPSAQQVIGAPPDQALGRWAGELCHPDDRAAVEEAQRLAAAGTPGRAITYRMPDGKDWRWLETSLQPVHEDGAVTAVVASTRDVTRRVEAERALRESEELHRVVLTHLPDALVTLYDRDLRILSLHGGAMDRPGLDPETIVGRRLHDFPDADLDVLLPEFARALAGEERRFEYDGTITDRRYEVVLVPRRNAAGEIVGAVTVSRDISARHELEERLRHHAEHDPLTGLMNRRRFDEEIARHASRVRRYDEDGAVLLIDLDRFKEVNDTYGHAAGDDYLVRAADRLRTVLRDTDLVARLGGDEFAILLPHADAGEAAETARRLVAAMHPAPGEASQGDPAMTVSIGVACFADHPAADPAAVVAAADRAMYAAKTGGRDRYAVAGLSSNGAGA
ncbi:GGDEF domain-containing protein [Svornostia abyssi]